MCNMFLLATCYLTSHFMNLIKYMYLFCFSSGFPALFWDALVTNVQYLLVYKI